MENDLFESEQQIYDNAISRIEEVRKGASFTFEEYENIAKEYSKLLRQLRRATRLADRTTSGLHESNLDLTDKVHYDTLTKVYSRRYMEDNMNRIINFKVSSGKGQLSVMMVDVDHFKKYNDTYGHSKGDACLKSIAETLKASVMRADDFVVRYGGEEFAVILPNTNEHGANKIANRMLENIRALNIPHEKSEIADYVTISIGVTTGDVKYAQNEADYIKCADKALYISKQNGRNRYTYINLNGEKI